jgi:hypothetical protein
MHIAVRTACVLPLVLVQVSLPALAQNDSAPIVVPAQPLPPEKPPPEKQTPAEKAAQKLPLPPDTLEPEPELPRPPVPPPAPEAGSNNAPEDYPLSMQVLQVHMSYGLGWNPLTVTRGGIETPNLVEAVAGSARAASLIRAGQSEAATGTALAISGLVVIVGTLLVAIPIISSNNNNGPYTDQSGVVAGVLVGTLVGALLSSAGTAVQWGGYHQIVEGVNAYNADLLDGRLVAPAVTAVPPR